MVISKIFAVIIFVLMFFFIVTETVERHVTTLTAGAATLIIVFGFCMRSLDAIVRTLNYKSLFTLGFWYGGGEESSGINWATIIFIAGMTVMVEGMGHAGFFGWLCLKIAKLVKYNTVSLLICFMLMSAVLAMFIDSITVIMFLAAVTITLSQTLKFDPVPIVLAEIFCANLGGSATMCGDPPNIIIGTALGYSFFDFLSNTGVIALISLVFVIAYFYFVMRKPLKESEKERPSDIVYPKAEDEIKNKGGFIGAVLVFGIIVCLLVTHSITELSVATIGVVAIILTIISISLTFGPKTMIEIFKKVDYKTLLFFVGLFVVVSGLEETGCLEIVASFIEKISGGNPMLMVAIILWISAICSAFVDNIPFAATMVPVIESMAAGAGIPLATLAWTLALGTDIGGSATPIGASANVVGTSLCAKAKRPVTWKRYCMYNAPATIIVIAICLVCVYARYFWNII